MRGSSRACVMACVGFMPRDSFTRSFPSTRHTGKSSPRCATSFETLNQALRRIQRNKAELLLVLDRPDIALHTNGSERDLRDPVKKRKVSGGTRSDLGRRCRDTFMILKRTCRKLGISFWQYLADRLSHTYAIPPLPDLIQQQAAPNP